jgi:hypothetical protein
MVARTVGHPLHAEGTRISPPLQPLGAHLEEAHNLLLKIWQS